LSRPHSGQEHSIVSVTIERILSQGDSYFEAIATSVQIAQEGRNLAEDGLDLHNCLISGAYTIEELTSFLSSMIRLAKTAYDRAHATVERFRSIRREIFKVKLYSTRF
jgi:hypothetical protein